MSSIDNVFDLLSFREKKEELLLQSSISNTENGLYQSALKQDLIIKIHQAKEQKLKALEEQYALDHEQYEVSEQKLYQMINDVTDLILYSEHSIIYILRSYHQFITNLEYNIFL